MSAPPGMPSVSSSATGWFAGVFLILYCMPAFLLAYYFLFQEASWIFDTQEAIPGILQVLATEHTSAFSLLHRFLLPVITFISTISAADPRRGSLRGRLIVLTVFLLFVLIGMHVAFSYSIEQTRVGGVASPPLEAVNGLFARLTETLGAYLAVLLGLQLRPADPALSTDAKVGI